MTVESDLRTPPTGASSAVRWPAAAAGPSDDFRPERTAAGRAAVVLFLGPTLPRPEAAALLQADIRPPARRGDVHRALRDGYRVIVLVDGEFHGRPSVWQREILDALSEGAAVHGCSSMGALRAAELHPFGMAGHGRIFEWYRDGIIDGDDEVALTYGPAEMDYPPLSEPLVNIRATLAAAGPEVMSAAERDALLAHAKALYFPNRSFAALAREGPAARWPAARREALARFVSGARVDLKRADAVAALKAVAARGADVDGRRLSGGAANALWRRERLVAEGVVADLEAADPVAIARRAGLSADELSDIYRDLSETFFVAAWARARGIGAAEEDFAEVRKAATRAGDFSPRRLRSLLETRATARAAVRARSPNGGGREASRAIVGDWAAACGVERAGLRGDALIDWIIDEGPGRFGYLWPFGAELCDALRLGMGPRAAEAVS